MLQVLYIDSYDSFAYNVTSLLKESLNETFKDLYKDLYKDEIVDYHITHIQNDYYKKSRKSGVDEEDLKKIVEFYDFIVIGPGPGSPTSKEDTGLIYNLYQYIGKNLSLYRNVPIFGICLGFQTMCYHLDSKTSNNKIAYLEKPVHGQIGDIEVVINTETYDLDSLKKMDILYNEKNCKYLGTRYHSIYYDINAISESSVIPFAYAKNIDYNTGNVDANKPDILMAGMIKDTNIMGVQYHLESCCSNHGKDMMKNYIKEIVIPQYELVKHRIRDMKLLEGVDESFEFLKDGLLINETEKNRLSIKKVHLEGVNDILNLHLNLINHFKNEYGNCLMLGSLVKQKHRGEFSIFGVPSKDASNLYCYDINEKSIDKNSWGKDKVAAECIKQHQSRNDYYKFIENQMIQWKQNLIVEKETLKDFEYLPFVGGYLGILNYEMGDDVPEFSANELYENNINAIFAEVKHTLVWDHFENDFYFVDIYEDKSDILWTTENVKFLETQIIGVEQDQSLSNKSKSTVFPVETFKTTDLDSYKEQFDLCQKYLNRGDSYELCLTCQCKVSLKEEIDPLILFCKLSNMNPAPFSSYLSFPNIKVNLLSSSPERFIKWDKNLDCVELRPIKGTVSKKKDPTMTFEKAESILKTPKEFGENLMIVDLIRNDLYKLLEKVQIDSLMTVEEYETVYQLVSVIKGEKPLNSALGGLDILKSSLPPGSMTGAPKIKSVELLQQEIEKKDIHERGIYSGVTGFYSLNMKGDWSVNIRCLFSNDNKLWRLGAGGAITVLSDLEGEYEEMKIKLDSAMQIF